MKYAGLLLLAVISAGCVASSTDAQRQRLQAGLEDREILTFEAVHHWYRQYRNPKFAYKFDERDGSFSEAVKKRLASVIPEFERKGDGAFFYVSVPKIVFPEPSFGYAEVIVGDPFYAERYVEVFEKKENVWQIIDSVTIASGTLDAIITEFNWPIYFRDLKNRRPNRHSATRAAVRRRAIHPYPKVRPRSARVAIKRWAKAMRALIITFPVGAILSGCSMFISETAALSTLRNEEAQRLMHVSPNLQIEGTFSSKPVFERDPKGGGALGRDSMEDFFFSADVSPSDSDSITIRRADDGSLVFILTRNGALFLTFRATASTNSLRLDEEAAAFSFDRVVIAEGAEEKSWTDMIIRSRQDGGLAVEVAFRNRHTALAIPYDHSAGKWVFSLKRIL